MMASQLRTCPHSLARRPSAGASGFTMAEVLVAVTILSVAFAGLIGLFASGHANISQSGRDTTATVIAQSLAENMRNQPPPDLQLLDGMDTSNPAACPGAPGDRINTLCTDWVAQASQLPEGRSTIAVVQTANPVTGIILRTITISVAWSEANFGSRQLTLVVGRSE